MYVHQLGTPHRHRIEKIIPTSRSSSSLVQSIGLLFRTSLAHPPPLPQRDSNTRQQRQGHHPGQGARPTVRLLKRRRLPAGHLVLLERDGDGVRDRHHEPEHERTLLLVAAAGLVGPPGNQGRVAAVAAREDESRHAKIVGHRPGRQDGKAESPQQTDAEADGAAAANLVGDVAGSGHDEEVDGADGGGDVVDLRDGEAFRPLEVEGKVLHHVVAARQAPEAVGQSEGVDLPRREDAPHDGPSHLSGRGAALLIDALAGTLLLPVGKPEGLCRVRSVGVAEL